MASIRPPFGGRKRIDLLVLGLDDGQGGQSRSDSMILARIDTEARRISALSIPRDTRVPLGEGHYGKINAAHARGGPALAARAVSALTGLPVDYTLTANFDGFSRLVDLVGGIDLDVEQAMDYDDQWGHLHIHLTPGRQHLDGARAIQYVRFRKSTGGHGAGDGSDISRIGRQQKFVEALAARCLVGTCLTRLPEIVREGRRQVHTDLAAGDLLYLAGLAKEIGAGRVKLLTVPGKTALMGGQSYWIPARRELVEVVQQLDSARPRPASPVTVAVLNASHCRGLGREVAGRLTRRGYHIESVATSSEDLSQSQVIADPQSRSGAAAIASLLECNCTVERAAPTAADGAQVTVLVGRDYAAKRGLRTEVRAWKRTRSSI